MRDFSMPSILFSKTVLSNFAHAQSFDLLHKLYKDRGFTHQVILHEIPVDPQEKSWLKLPDYTTNPDSEIIELKLAINYNEKLGSIESELLALAESRDWILATDSIQSRNIAKAKNIKLTGSAAILIKAVKQTIISSEKADSFHAYMVNAGYKSQLNYEKGISVFLRKV
jgi:predicted nucleic acid-binding protein